MGQLIHIEVLDHLIITEENYASLADRGIMDQLKKSGLFEIMGPEKKELEQWKIDMEKKRAEKQKALDIAKKMKDDGVEIDTIKKYTGLTNSAINKL